MFTGIVENTGRIKIISRINDSNTKAHSKICIDLGKLSRNLKTGDSMSINGTCLTVTKLRKNIADFEIVEETVAKTSLGELKIGDSVNLERSLRIDDRIEGHLVLGHVDGTGRIKKIIRSKTQTKIWIKVDNNEILESMVPKGSVAVDGISLTVVDVNTDAFSIVLVPHTLSITTINSKIKGDLVNLEVDILSRYIKNIYQKSSNYSKFSKIYN